MSLRAENISYIKKITISACGNLHSEDVTGTTPVWMYKKGLYINAVLSVTVFYLVLVIQNVIY